MQESPEVTIEQLTARFTLAVETIEQAVPRIVAAAGDAIGPIVATVESPRESELAQLLADAEKTIAELRAAASIGGRRTLPVSLAARHDGAAVEPGAIDAALTSLSLEQRIAVKSQLLRAGLI
jgi:hypothetical protein